MVKPAPAQTVASIRAVSPTIEGVGYYCLTLYAQLYASLRREGIPALQPEITLYHNEEYTETDIDVEAAVPIAPEHLREAPPEAEFQVRELPPSELTAALIYEGPFPEITPAILALLRYVGTHGHMPAGPLRELHLSGPAHDEAGVEQENPVIELQVPIQPLADR